MSDLANKFVTESDVEEAKKKRQEEWEKVRKPDQPLEAPEEKYDPRCLYERLQEQKMKKDEEFEETHKLKLATTKLIYGGDSSVRGDGGGRGCEVRADSTYTIPEHKIRGLDEEETDFLEFVSDRQRDHEKAKRNEEQQMLDEFRNSVGSSSSAVTASKSSDKKTSNALVQSKSSTSSSKQKLLLAGALKRKSSDPTPTDGVKMARQDPPVTTTAPLSTAADSRGHAVVIGTLPGLGEYTNSSDETSDSNSEDSDVDTTVFRKAICTQHS